MTDREICIITDMVVDKIITRLRNDDELLYSFAKVLAIPQKPKLGFVGTKEAANILGISASLLYKIKNDTDGRKRFSYIKSGKAKSSPLKFNEATLIEEYEKYLEEQ